MLQCLKNVCQKSLKGKYYKIMKEILSISKVILLISMHSWVVMVNVGVLSPGQILFGGNLSVRSLLSLDPQKTPIDPRTPQNMPPSSKKWGRALILQECDVSVWRPWKNGYTTKGAYDMQPLQGSYHLMSSQLTTPWDLGLFIECLLLEMVAVSLQFVNREFFTHKIMAMPIKSLVEIAFI